MQAVIKSAPVDGAAGTEIRDCPVPKPGPDEVLIRVTAAAICGTDKHIYHWDPSIRDSVHPPRIYGHEFCGVIESLGSNVDREELKPGAYVSAEMHIACGHCFQCRSGNGHICSRTKILGLHDDGAFAQFVKVPAANVICLGPFVPLRVGAFLDALGNAVHSTQVVDLAGKSVAITGFGPIGAMAAAIAEQSGASLVVVTDVSDHALETARRWAAGRAFENLHAFNVRTTDAATVKQAVNAITNGLGVEVVLEMSGSPAAVTFGLDVVHMGGFLALPRGWSSLLNIIPDRGADNSDWLMPLNRLNTRTIDRSGGTILHTSRVNPAISRAEQVPPHLVGEMGRPDERGRYDLTQPAL